MDPSCLTTPWVAARTSFRDSLRVLVLSEYPRWGLVRILGLLLLTTVVTGAFEVFQGSLWEAPEEASTTTSEAYRWANRLTHLIEASLCVFALVFVLKFVSEYRRCLAIDRRLRVLHVKLSEGVWWRGELLRTDGARTPEAR